MSELVDVRIKKLTPTAKLPTQGSEYAAGYDIYADIQSPIMIKPHETVKVHTGLAAAVPEGYWLGLFARSGLATKQGLRPANCTGVIDPDYRGEIIMAVHNDTDTTRVIFSDDRIGQLIILPRFGWNMTQVDELDPTDRAEGGFGSTGQ